MAGNPVILENVGFSYESRPILYGIDLELRAGEITCLLGPSGCGKTTLLKLCAGLLKPASGQIHAPFPRPGADIGYMQQEAGLLPWRNVRENVLLGCELLGRESDRRHAMDALEKVGLRDKAECFPETLSGGQQQRVALARQLVIRPKLLLLDEPLGALDILLRQELAGLIQAIVEDNGISALVVTHSPDEAIHLGDRVCLLGGSPASIAHRWRKGELDPKTAFYTVTQSMRGRVHA